MNSVRCVHEHVNESPAGTWGEVRVRVSTVSHASVDHS